MKETARRIRDQAVVVRETVKTLRESGAIEELAIAIKEISIAARDTSREINETAKQLREQGVIKDTAASIDETTAAWKNTADEARRAGDDIRANAPQTIEAAKKVAEGVKSQKESMQKEPV
jgi:methyl-accepting chemotaxis protein